VLELSDEQVGRSTADTVPAQLDLSVALARLSERQRLAVALHYYLGLPVAEAAVVMACSPGTVKSTLSDARARLRAILGDDYA
jgi:RNA polymerase sigma-70 factor (ECF subfamily)